MGRLINLKPRLGMQRQRLERVGGEGRDRERLAANPSRGWYSTKRWQNLRRQVLLRDGYSCQKTGEILSGKYPAPNSPVVDHIRPHRGDEKLFWDPNNLQSVSKKYHDSVKQRIEKGGVVKV